MGATQESQARGQDGKAPHGFYRGIKCAEIGCGMPAKCKGKCASHYNKWRWSQGHRSPCELDRRRQNGARIKYRYGISVEEYETLLEQQNGRCAICGTNPIGKSAPINTLCIDHDHATGRVRGLLCNSCNLAIGYLKTPEGLDAAASYLRLHSR